MGGANLDARTAENAVLGSVVMAAGGGGSVELGLRLGQMAVELGHASRVSLDCLSSTTEIAAVAALDEGTREHPSYRLAYHRRALELLTSNAKADVGGLVPVGGGALNVMASWGQAALLDIPLIDASFETPAHPCPWRAFVDLLAHDVPVISLAVVGKPAGGEEQLETFLRGGPGAVSTLIERLAAAGGSYALCFGPLSSKWVRGRAQVGRMSRLIEVGGVLRRATADGGRMVAQAVSQAVGGQLVMPATVAKTSWTRTDGGALGVIRLLDEKERSVRLTHWHRYVALEGDDGRLATFPDLIVTLGARGTPLQADELGEGQDVFIVIAPPQFPSPLEGAAPEAVPDWLAVLKGEGSSTPAVAACAEDRGPLSSRDGSREVERMRGS